MLSFKDLSILAASTASTASFRSTETYGPYLSCVFHLMRYPTNMMSLLSSEQTAKLVRRLDKTLGSKHLVACHEQVIDMKTKNEVKSLYIFPGYWIDKIVNFFRNGYLLSTDTACVVDQFWFRKYFHTTNRYIGLRVWEQGRNQVRLYQ